jgi:hypothetical protein
MPVLLRVVFFGVLATFTMDILTAGALKLRLISPLSPNLIGRWFASFARGKPVHRDIAEASPINHELAIAVPVHYAIGVTLAFVYLFATSSLGLSPRNPLIALGFALFTNVLPWLLMFPAMGYGWFGMHGPPKTRLFLSSLVTHAFYGLGLWLSSSILI